MEKNTPNKTELRKVRLSPGGTLHSQVPGEEAVIMKSMEACGVQLAKETASACRKLSFKEAEVTGICLALAVSIFGLM